jgi:tetratricopeptide (TPR) repeat protein
MATAFFAALALLSLFASALTAQETNSTNFVSATNASADLAKQAAEEDLPQVSAAVLRTQIQQEQDPAKRMDLTRRLVVLLVNGGRCEEALAVSTTVDVGEDSTLAYWKGMALLGTGDTASAKEIFSSLLSQKSAVEGVSSDQITLALARALRGTKETEEALKLLDTVPANSSVAEDIVLEKGIDLLALGRTEECLKFLQGFSPASDEGKAMSIYLKALVNWRLGNFDEAKKLFLSIPPVSPWCSAASTLGGALCLGASGTTGTSVNPAKVQQGIDLLEKHLDQVDDDPLLEDQFRLLDQLYGNAATPDTTMLKKWADDSSHPTRAQLALFYQAKGELRLKHPEGGETLMDSLIRKSPDAPIADLAREKLCASRLQRGLTQDALGWSADRPAAPAAIRAKLAYLRGLALASLGKSEEAKRAFQLAASLDPTLAQNAHFNRTVLVATTDKGSLDTSAAAQSIVAMNEGLPSEEMEFQIALDLARRGDPKGVALMGRVADISSEASLKSRARLAAAEWNMKSGRKDVADADFAKAVHENSGDPEREEYLNVFLKDTGKKSDAPGVIAAARSFLQAHPDSGFNPEVRLKLAEALLASGDVQAARVEFEQLAYSGAGTEIGRRALFLAAQSAARSMDPASLDDSLMLLERVAENGNNDQLVWQARLQQGALKNAQNLPLEAIAIYDKILAASGPGSPDVELRAAAMMAKADTLHQLATKEPNQDREALKIWSQLAADRSMPLRLRNQSLCKSGIILEKLGEADAALAAYYQSFKNPRGSEPEQLWHDKAAFEAGQLLESRKQWNDAVTLYGQIVAEGGPRAEEAKARLSKLRLENFLWEN